MRSRTRAGTSLIEVLVVIVVFLVGILAIIQIFPGGFSTLRTTRSNTMAENLGRAEMERLMGSPARIAELIAPVTYVTTASGVRVQIDSGRLARELMPAKDPDPAPGRISRQGQVLVNNQPIGLWDRVSGANLFSRVIGEGAPVPAPRRLPGLPGGLDFGGLVQLQFAPIYYFPTGSGVGERGVLQVYGNDLVRRFGDRDRGNPNPNGRVRDWEFFVVGSEDTDDTNFPNEDQLWVAPAGFREYRISFSFAYQNAGGPENFDVIVPVVLDPANPPAYAVPVGPFWVISFSRLIAEPDLGGSPSPYNPANFLAVDRDSVRVQRIFQELPAAAAWDTQNPYQYKVVNPFLGYLIMNPAAANYSVRTANGARVPLLAVADYTVFDWRIIRDDFRVPADLPFTIKLALNSIKPRSGNGIDTLARRGLGIDTPDVNLAVASQDFVLQDMESGGIILGNLPNDPNAPGFPQNPLSAYSVDKTNGFITFRDVDAATPGLGAWVSFPNGTGGWSARQLVPDIAGRNVRALYMGNGEWAVQPLKAARNYRVTGRILANGLQVGECYIGGSVSTSTGTPIGNPSRLYFPPSDLGQKVVIGEVWHWDGGNPGSVQVLNDQDYLIGGLENVNGANLAYVDITERAGPGRVFNFSNGYAVRRVRGASLKVRVLWNPTSFFLTNDTALNYENLEEWMRSTRRIEIQGFQSGGDN